MEKQLYAGPDASKAQTQPPESLLNLASEFYRIFYNRTLDDGMLSALNSLSENTTNPTAAFLQVCANSSEFKTRELYASVKGQYDTEAGTCWFGPEATIVIKKHPVYLSIPHDFPFNQKLILRSDVEEKILILQPGEAQKICNTSNLSAQVVSITAENIYCPLEYGRNDARNLCFQISAGDRNQLIIRDRPSNDAPLNLVAVSGSLKERRVLAILALKLEEQGLSCPLFDENDNAFDNYISGKPNLCFLIASADTFFLCERRVNQARYIYAEHGIAPFKGYSYAAHYKNYDHVMMPSTLLVNRIEKIHGKMNSSDIVGYPVLSTVIKSPPDIDILFAPTWSHNFDHIRAAQMLVQTAVNAGLRVAYVGHPDSLTGLNQKLKDRLVPASDIYVALGKSRSVITDFSSVGIEAAVLGIPVMLMQVFSLDDFDTSLKENSTIRVPHLENKCWDIGPFVNEENVIVEYERLTVNKEYFEQERLEWASLCHSVSVDDSVELSADSILNYLNLASKFNPNE